MWHYLSVPRRREVLGLCTKSVLICFSPKNSQSFELIEGLGQNSEKFCWAVASSYPGWFVFHMCVPYVGLCGVTMERVQILRLPKCVPDVKCIRVFGLRELSVENRYLENTQLMIPVSTFLILCCVWFMLQVWRRGGKREQSLAQTEKMISLKV